MEQTQKNFVFRLILVGIVLVVAFLAYYTYDLKQQVNQNISENTKERYKIERMYHKLDSISVELSDKMDSIASMGGEIDSLIVIKRQLENEKYHLRLTKSMDAQRFEQIENKVEGYGVLLERKKVEINILRSIIQELDVVNKTLQKRTDSLSREVRTLKDQKTILAEKLEQAKVLRISSIWIDAIDKNGKGQKSLEECSNKDIQGLKIRYQIEANPLTNRELKTIYVRITEPQGKTLFDERVGSQKFTLKGRTEFCTHKDEVMYQNKKQIITYWYDKGNTFQKGKHKIEIYCEDSLIGNQDFTIK